MPLDSITSAEINGETPAAYGRLMDVVEIVDRRLAALSNTSAESGRDDLLPPAWRQAPAYEVHVSTGLHELLADEECRSALLRIVKHGQQAHLVVFLHGVVEEVAQELAVVSGRLAAELVTGRALRVAVGCEGCRR